MKHIFCDIDGTLTTTGGKGWGPPNMEMINKIKSLIKDNFVVMWSARGKKYTEDFCKKYGIKANVFLRKPDYIVDDNLDIRDHPRMKRLLPKDFLKEVI